MLNPESQSLESEERDKADLKGTNTQENADLVPVTLKTSSATGNINFAFVNPAFTKPC